MTTIAGSVNVWTKYLCFCHETMRSQPRRPSHRPSFVNISIKCLNIFKKMEYVVLFLYKGGYSTSDEMCFSFIYYYPRLSIEMMIAGPIYDTIPGHKSRHQIVKIVEGYDWSNATVREKFQKDTNNSTLSEFCMLSHDRVSWKLHVGLTYQLLCL